MKSIINHLYWAAASSPDQDGELKLAKWKSLCNHIINVHNEGRERKKKWLKPGMVV
jgi:hypothetical protein